jgi:hypothetical protein
MIGGEFPRLVQNWNKRFLKRKTDFEKKAISLALPIFWKNV